MKLVRKLIVYAISFLTVIAMLLGLATGLLALIAPDQAAAALDALQTIAQGIQDLIGAAEEGLDALEQFQATPTLGE